MDHEWSFHCTTSVFSYFFVSFPYHTALIILSAVWLFKPITSSQDKHRPCCAVVLCLVTQWTLSNSLWPHGPQPTSFLCPQDSQGKNTGVSCHALLKGIFPPKDRTPVSHIAGRLFTIWATREALLLLEPNFVLRDNVFFWLLCPIFKPSCVLEIF